jgi:hypothetical protein
MRLARCLLFVGGVGDAHIAADETVRSSKSSETIEQAFGCDLCRNGRAIKGEAFLCKTCGVCTICALCIDKYRGGEFPRYCRHDNFLTIPRSVWKELDDGVVNSSGLTLDSWLCGLESRYEGLLEALESAGDYVDE